MSIWSDRGSAAPGREPSEAEAAVIRSYPVLYVDDEIHNIDVFEASFGDDFNILVAESGIQALDLLEREPIAVVVSDNRMPGMLGVELLHRVFVARPEIRRVLCTAYSDQQTAIDAINRAAVQHYLVKPWDHGHTLGLLRELVADVHLERTARQLRTDLVEREREACIAALRRRFEQDLGNVLSVLRGVDHGFRALQQSGALPAAALAEHDAGDLIGDLGGAVGALGKLHQFARLSSARPQLAPKEASAAELLHDVVRLVASDPSELARLSVDADPALHIWGDRLAVVKVMLRAIAWISSQHDEPAAVSIVGEERGAAVAFRIRSEPPIARERLVSELGSSLTFDADGVATLVVARELALAADATLEVEGDALVLSMLRAMD